MKRMPFDLGKAVSDDLSRGGADDAPAKPGIPCLLPGALLLWGAAAAG